MFGEIFVSVLWFLARMVDDNTDTENELPYQTNSEDNLHRNDDHNCSQSRLSFRNK